MSVDAKFDIAAMRQALLQCDANIRIFEDAICKEMNTKMEYQRIIRTLEEKAANPPKVIIETVVLDDEE